MTLYSGTWQLLFIDVLFLCLAGSLGLWFRAWLKAEKRALDERLTGLEEQQAHLERLSGRLLAACRLLEAQAPEFASGDTLMRRERGGGKRRAAAPQQHVGAQPDKADRYERARELLGRGLEPVAVARQLELGLAEVELMARMLQHRSRS